MELAFFALLGSTLFLLQSAKLNTIIIICFETTIKINTIMIKDNLDSSDFGVTVLSPVGGTYFFRTHVDSSHIHSPLHAFFICIFVSFHYCCSHAHVFRTIPIAILNSTCFFCKTYRPCWTWSFANKKVFIFMYVSAWWGKSTLRKSAGSVETPLSESLIVLCLLTSETGKFFVSCILMLFTNGFRFTCFCGGWWVK